MTEQRKKEREEVLKSIFDDLQESAYSVDSHKYDFKEANQVIRERVTEFQDELDALQSEIDSLHAALAASRF